MTYSLPHSRDEAHAADIADPLREKCQAFCLPDGVTYLDGHSLGPASHEAMNRVRKATTSEWADGLIRSWNDAGWIDLPNTVGAKLASLIGVRPREVIVTDSVSVNLFKLAAAALPLAHGRTLIVEADEFPTDQYMAQGLADLSGAAFKRAAPRQGVEVLSETGGVLLKSVVNYRTAELTDIGMHEAQARRSGGLIVWDLSHATGCVALHLHQDGARLATGCTYKYLNGGPGAPAFIYAASDLAGQLRSPLSGWFGHADPFAFDPDYRPSDGAARFAVGTPAILSLVALDGALSVFESIQADMLEEKARALGDLCLMRAAGIGLESLSPAIGAPRGGHVSLRHDQGYPIVQAMIDRRIIPDFRAPDAMRFGFSPLYVTFSQVWDAMDVLSEILADRSWDQPKYHARSKVT